jgi:CDP-6-deoxy-D-xylo-4-hexulose-3-dehydrase
MSELQDILKLVKQYAKKKNDIAWNPDKDWVSYSGHIFDENEYCAAVESLLDSWLVFGDKAREFEKAFPSYLGKKRGSLTNSGSSANLLAVSSLRSKNAFNFPEGSKIITPVSCFPTTLNPIIQNGFEPVFVDVTLPDLNLDLDQVEEELKKDPSIRGIMFAHVFGNPPDMERLMSIVREYDLIFIEDSCDALGSYYDGKKLGSFGHISTCSFYPAHHMTMGEGGFVATDDPAARKAISSIRDWGRACYCNSAKTTCTVSSTACGNRFRNWLPGLPDAIYDHRYVYDEIGYNLKPLELQAAIGLEQLCKLPDLDAARRRNFEILQEIFRPYKEHFHLPEPTEKSDPCWFAYLLTIKESAYFTRQDIVSHLENNRIQTRSYFSGNILAHPAYHHLAGEYGDLKKAFPIASLSASNSFFLGTFAGLTEEKLDYVKKVVDDFFRRNK